jgi:predicted component of type VI protein secretion system
VDKKPPPCDLGHFLSEFRAAIIVLSGGASGMEYVLDQRRISVGRGPGVDLALDDPSLASLHAVLEFEDGGFSLRSMTKSADMQVNGSSVTATVLKTEDRFQLGGLTFSYVVEPRVSL